MTAPEHLYVSCTCEGGMRDGARCADCRGRGIVVKGTQITGETLEEPTPPDPNDLENLGINELRIRAKELGVGAGGSKAALIERIREVLPDPDDEADDLETGQETAAEA